MQLGTASGLEESVQEPVWVLSNAVKEVLAHIEHWRTHAREQLADRLVCVEQSIEAFSKVLEELVQRRQSRMAIMQQKPQLWRLVRTLFCYVHTRPEVVADLLQSVRGGHRR
jgi:hypothetical protein